MLGIEEVANGEHERRTTVTCKSNGASVFFMAREDFIKSVNLYKFSDQILTERCLKQHILDRRLGETLAFLKSDAV